MKLVKKVFLVGVAACAPSAAFGQSGNAMPEPRFDLSFSARDSFDTDSLKGADIRQNRPGAEKGDFVFAPTLNGNISQPIGRHFVTIGGSLGYQFYKRNSYLNRENIALQGGVTLRATRECNLSFSGTIQRRQSDLADFVDSFDPENLERAASGGGSVSCQSPTGIVSSLGYQRSNARNSSPIRQSSNYEADSLNASVGITRPVLGTVSVYTSYTSVGYARGLATVDGIVADGVKIYGGGLRFQRDIGARMRGGGSIGYSYVEQKIPGLAGSRGLNYGLDLSYDSRNRLKMSTSFARTTQQSGQFGVSFGTVHSAGFNADYKLTRSIGLSSGVSYSTRTSRLSALTTAGIPFNTQDKTFSTNARVRFIGGGPIGLSADISHQRRRSNVSGFNFNSTRFGITANYTFRGNAY